MIGLDVEGYKQRHNSKSSFNLLNVSVVMNLALDLINKNIINPEQLVILTCYRAQYKIYRQGFAQPLAGLNLGWQTSR
jgi:hypothetical protein